MPEPRCPVCREIVRFASHEPAAALRERPHFPFCSERCKMVDLGRWFAEDYRIQRAIGEDDLPEAFDETLS